MGFRINTNVLSISAQRNLGISSKALGKALERLASGSRINRAGDDAAGLAISEGLGAQVRGVKVAIRNANDAIGFLNTAEGALAELTNITQRLRELAIQAANGTLGASDRGFLNDEKIQLIEEFDRIAKQSNFNGSNLLDGSFSTTDLQVGVNKGETISFTIGDARASSLGALASKSGIQNALTADVTNLSINGLTISQTVSTDDSLSVAGNSYSAISIAKKVNAQSGTTKVYADIQTTIVKAYNLDFSGFGGSLTNGNLVINGTNITGTANSVNSFIDLVNTYSNATGVKARLQSGSTTSIELYAADGRNVRVVLSNNVLTGTNAFFQVFEDGQNFTTTSIFSSGATISLTTGDVANVHTGAIKLRSAVAISLAGSSTSTILGFSATTIAVDSTTAVNSISLATQAGAQNALATLDATLSQLNTLRSGLGATQSRLDSTVQSLGVTLENISSARSSIRDADVAQETADLTRAQILQQAGIAVLGQANTSSQSALALLKF